MVDLVKIRKKAKKAREDAESGPATGDSSPSSRSETMLAPARSSHSPEEERPASDGSALPSVPLSAKTPLPDQEGSSTKLDRFKEEAGKRREVAVVSHDTSDDGWLEVLTFLLAGEQYAVGIERIVEIVSPRPVTRIPNSDQMIVGIISLRGTMVTLLDVRHKLRHQAGAVAEDPRIIVVDQAGETIGFEVDRVLRVLKVDAADVAPHPVVHASELDGAIRGVFGQGSSLTILLDLDKLLQVA